MHAIHTHKDTLQHAHTTHVPPHYMTKHTHTHTHTHHTQCNVCVAVQDDTLQCLETLGSRVGSSLVERTSRDTPRFKNELDAVVFICKQFWNHAFNKQIDNLKTNHQVYLPHRPPYMVIIPPTIDILHAHIASYRTLMYCMLHRIL